MSSLASFSFAPTCTATYSGVFSTPSKCSVYSNVFGEPHEPIQTELSPSAPNDLTVSESLGQDPPQPDRSQLPEAVSKVLRSGRRIVDERQKQEVTPTQAIQTLEAALDSVEGSTVKGFWDAANRFHIHWHRFNEDLLVACVLLTVFGPPLVYVVHEVVDGVHAVLDGAGRFPARAAGVLNRALD